MTDKLSERLHKAVLSAYAEAQANEGTSRLLSELQILIDDEVTTLEAKMEDVSAKEVAEMFHEAYERLAPEYGYTTREDTKTFDADSLNGRLMIAVVSEIKEALAGERDE